MTKQDIIDLGEAYYGEDNFAVSVKNDQGNPKIYDAKGIRFVNGRRIVDVYTLYVKDENLGTEEAWYEGDRGIPNTPEPPSTAVRDAVITFLNTQDANFVALKRWDNLFVSEEKVYATVTIWWDNGTKIEERRYFIWNEGGIQFKQMITV